MALLATAQRNSHSENHIHYDYTGTLIDFMGYIFVYEIVFNPSFCVIIQNTFVVYLGNKRFVKKNSFCINYVVIISVVETLLCSQFKRGQIFKNHFYVLLRASTVRLLYYSFILLVPPANESNPLKPFLNAAISLSCLLK